jgi:hypothetical protein
LPASRGDGWVLLSMMLFLFSMMAGVLLSMMVFLFSISFSQLKERESTYEASKQATPTSTHSARNRGLLQILFFRSRFPWLSLMVPCFSGSAPQSLTSAL